MLEVLGSDNISCKLTAKDLLSAEGEMTSDFVMVSYYSVFQMRF